MFTHKFRIVRDTGDKPARHGSTKPVVREILFFEPFKRKNTDGYFHNPTGVRLIKKVKSDENGFYQVKLPVGRYSVVVKEGDLYYGNLTDADGYVNPIEVQKRAVSVLNIRIHYKASF